MDTETGWEKKIGLADMHGTVAEIGYSPEEDDLPPCASFLVSSGAARVQCNPTPTALRQLAAAALDAAEAMEAT
jgi:hypothetical protein